MPRCSCWKCGRDSGRFQKTVVREELFCENCLVWCTVDGLLHHGPISNLSYLVQKRGGRLAPQLNAYPASWQFAYVSSQPAFNEEMFNTRPQTPLGENAAQAMLEVLLRE